MDQHNEIISSLAGEIMGLSRDDILMHLRLFDRALTAIRLTEKPGTEEFATDGYGVYPERPPDYQVIFAFLEEDENRGPMPSWSMKVVLDSCI